MAKDAEKQFHDHMNLVDEEINNISAKKDYEFDVENNKKEPKIPKLDIKNYKKSSSIKDFVHMSQSSLKVASKKD